MVGLGTMKMPGIKATQQLKLSQRLQRAKKQSLLMPYHSLYPRCNIIIYSADLSRTSMDSRKLEIDLVLQTLIRGV